VEGEWEMMRGRGGGSTMVAGHPLGRPPPPPIKGGVELLSKTHLMAWPFLLSLLVA